MARIRTIKPEFWSSEQVVECSTTARLLFLGLWNFCDDGGVHPASTKRLKMEVFPADSIADTKISACIKELIEARLVESYRVDTKEFWRVTGWHHQRIEKPTYLYPRSKEFGEQSSIVRRTVGDSSPPESSRVESSLKESINVTLVSADVGKFSWEKADRIAERLHKAGIDHTKSRKDGRFLRNVSFLLCVGCIPENAFESARESTAEKKADKPIAFFRACLKNQLSEVGISLAQIDQFEIPELPPRKDAP